MSSESVEISPDVLRFHSQSKTQSTDYITITNKSDETIAFKVKTTAPKLYCVRPNAATVAKGGSVKVSVIFLGLSSDANMTADNKCKDKFLVVSLPAPYKLNQNTTVADVWSDLEAEFRDQTVSKKLRVEHVVDETPASDAAESAPAVKSAPIETSTDTPDLKTPLPDTLKSETKPVTEPVKPTQEPRQKSGPSKNIKSYDPPIAPTAEISESSSPSSTTFLFFVLIALALGWLYY
ncbi:uncharacterized protein KNAG_0B02180 [Huiozyma naganishii CBS 8797]|uniref:MSP domain-containing protein n=1 Tax=Huiozyma naganishii (strain ATCC MYA-139 / BCRC 22969 / CBS 8797 / KCTC 17520 / NBRC 10181 / NCYC 3082 / Yp74L-3) TaxID=1071383 RepID=J7R1H0_HUIN7|nr:hypothetical protein KNAG_0B02180 [Kazachstania naganishii CBS 8797]CCK68660.1 hypothetical protein KNAG_0B02180 [Kazachstania naganishii CBS 8797]